MTRVSPMLVFQARAEARALLYKCGEFDLDEAIGPLMLYAHRRGIVERIGVERAFAVIQQAFKGTDAEL